MSASNGKRVLGRDDLLTMKPPAPARLELDEGVIFVRAMTPWERDVYDNAQFEYKDGKAEARPGARGWLIALCACDEEGRRLFEDAEALTVSHALPGPVAERIVQEATRINRIGPQAQREAEKNSAAGAACASSSSSPAT